MTYIELHDIAKQELERYKQIEGLSPKLKRSIIKQMREDFYSLKTICQTDKRYKNIFKY